MKVLETALPGVLIVEPDVYRDERGFFLESYRADRYAAAGIGVTFVQDNHSRSARGVLRGLHMQWRNPQAKLVRVIEGSIFDVIVDVRRGSPTYRQHVAVEVSADNFRQVFVPDIYAHGLAVTSEFAQVEYKVSAFYDPQGELTIRWDEPELAIPWPVASPTLSKKDQVGLTLDEAQAYIARR